MGELIGVECVDIADPIGVGIAKFRYMNIGPVMVHNYLCACCRRQKAVIETWHGILQPCWDCQKQWKLVRLNWFDKLLGRHK